MEGEYFRCASQARLNSRRSGWTACWLLCARRRKRRRSRPWAGARVWQCARERERACADREAHVCVTVVLCTSLSTWCHVRSRQAPVRRLEIERAWEANLIWLISSTLLFCNLIHSNLIQCNLVDLISSHLIWCHVRSRLAQVRGLARRAYNSPVSQSMFAVVIIISFISSLAEAEIQPPEGSATFHLFQGLELMFAVAFALVRIACGVGAATLQYPQSSGGRDYMRRRLL